MTLHAMIYDLTAEACETSDGVSLIHRIGPTAWALDQEWVRGRCTYDGLDYGAEQRAERNFGA